ncbi:MAG: hypothetical protein HFE36_00715 [Clostridia bacterium]|nr:hypothetical protein [Clostridia bacterium]
MKFLRSLTGKHKPLAAVCVFLCCMALSLFMLLPSLSYGASAADGDISGGANGVPAQARPLKSYTNMNAVVPSGMVIYKGLTTVADVKNNISVTGDYAGGTVELEASEFSISLDGVMLADGDFVVSDGDDVPAVQLDVECGSLLVSLSTLNVAEQDEIPQYTLFELKDPPVFVESDHTGETLKKLLTVCGKLAADGTPEVIANKELYTVEIAGGGTLSSTNNKIKVKFRGGKESDEIALTVKNAEIKGIFVTVNKDLKLVDGYYKTNELIEGTSEYYSAFVTGMLSDDIIPSLSVYIQYSNHRKLATEQDGYIKNTNIIDNTITVTWSPSGSSKDYTDSLSVPFEAEKVVGISAVSNLSGELYSYTDINSGSSFTVKAKYNNKNKAENEIAEYSVDSSLVYNNEVLSGATGSQTYTKVVKISYTNNPNITASVEIPNVRYVADYNVVDISGAATRQTLGADFDFRGLFAVVVYGDNGEHITNIKFDEYKEKFASGTEFKIEYFNNPYATGIPIASGIKVPTERFQSVKITHGGVFNKFTVTNLNPAKLDKPIVDTRDINYRDGIYKTISGLDLMNVPAAFTVTVSEKVASGDEKIVTAEYAPNTDCNISVHQTNPGVTYTADGKIVFMRGGEFVVNFALKDGVNGSYGWAKTNDYNTEYDYTLSYAIKVNKGELDVRIKNKNDNTATLEVEYGSKQDLKNKIENALTVEYYTYGGSLIPESQKPDAYTLKYYGFTANGVTYTYTNLSDSVPEEAGVNYKIVAVTKETDAYKASTTLLASAVTLDITPKKVKIASVAPDKYYERKQQPDGTKGWKADELVTIPADFLDRDKPSSGSIVTIEDAREDKTAPILHAGTYPIKLTINSKNYEWDSTEAALNADGYSEITTDFTILKRATSGITITSPDSFTYGENGGFSASVDKSNAADTYFYPTLNTEVEYYSADYYESLTADSSGYKYPDKTKAITAELKSWDAGKYYVYFRTELSTDNGWDETAEDYTLPAAAKAITVLKKQVANAELSGVSGLTYKGADHTVTIANFLPDIMKYSVTYDRIGAEEGGGGLTDGVTVTGGTFTALHAGYYTVTVKFNDTAKKNYSWTTPEIAELSLTFIVNKFTLAVSSWGESTFEYDGKNHKPEVAFTLAGSDELSAVGVTLTVYASKSASGEFGNEVADSLGPTAAGEYWHVITAITSPDYAMPADYFKSFTIGKADILLPNASGAFLSEIGAEDGVSYTTSGVSGDILAKLTATYRGAEYAVQKYFKDYADRVTVTSESGNALKNAGTYTVIITPGNNYKWQGVADGVSQTARKITFVIEKATVTLSWNTKDSNGNAYVYSGSAHTPKVTAGALFGSDSVNVSFEIKQGSAVVPAINAGKYTVTATALDNDNYKLPADETVSAEFEILKKGVAAPQIAADSKVTFGGSALPEFTADTDWAAIFRANATVNTVWSNPWSSANSNEASSSGNFQITANGFNFTYTDAGTYTVTFTLHKNGDISNYRFGTNGNTEKLTASIAITVNRKLITVSGFGDRQLTYGQGMSLNIGEWDITAITPTVTYGKVTLNDGSVSRDNFKSEPYLTDRGVYCVKYTLASAGGEANQNPYNYEWDTESLELTDTAVIALLGGSDKYIEFDEQSFSLYVHYAVTSAMLRIETQFDSYTYGENAKNILSKIFKVTGTDADLAALASDSKTDGKFTLTVRFTDKKTNGLVGGFTFKSGGSALTVLTGSDLENYLPWNAGEYYVNFNWEFDESKSDYFIQNPEQNSVTLTVNKLAVSADSVVWKYGETAVAANEHEITYNGQSHNFAAALKDESIPKRASVTVDAPTLRVALNGAGDTPKDVKYDVNAVIAHTMYVIETDNDNFTCKNASGEFIYSKGLKIQPKTVKVKGKDKTHVYGENLTVTAADWCAYSVVGSDEFCSPDTIADLINIAIYDGSTAVTPNNLLAYKEGGYIITPELKNKTGNYVLEVTQSGTLTVVKRAITVTVDHGLTSEYGDAPVDIMDGHYSVTVTNGNGDALPEAVSNVFSLAAKSDSAAVSETTDYGEYGIEIDKNKSSSNNYDITFVSAQYSITRATLKVSVNFKIYFGEVAPDNYNGGCYNLNLQDTAMYAVSGFKQNANNDESSFYNNKITAGFGYAVSGYNVGDIGEFDITFNDNGLIWGNYEFENDAENAGKLTVQKLPVTVTVNDQTAQYFSPLNELTFAAVASVKSSYDNAADIAVLVGADFNDYGKIFALSVANLTLSNDGTKVANPVGTYDIVGATNESTNAASYYDITFVRNGHADQSRGEYVITPAEFSVTAAAKTGLAFTGNEQNPLTGDRISVTAADGSTPTVQYYLSVSQIADPANISGWGADGAVPTALHAHGGYYLYYKVSDKNATPNFNQLIGFVTFDIDTATNVIKQSFNYNDKAFANLSAEMDSAWTYGGFTQGMNGFITPSAKFTSGGTKFTVTVKFARELSGNTLLGEQTLLSGATLNGGIVDLLDSVFGNNKFGAGYYSVEYSMPEYTQSGYNLPDYSAIRTEVRYFRVDKKELTVTAANSSVQYGDGYVFASDFDTKTEFAGFAYGEDRTALDIAFNWQTSYAAGDDAASMQTIDIENASNYVSDNYSFKFVSGALTVTKRTVSITIANKSNHFDLIQGEGREEAASLEYSVSSGTFYNNIVPFELKTEALTPYDGKNTNHVGDYPIYAVWKTSGGTPYAHNYEIAFVDCVNSFNGDNVIGETENAGTFTIASALLNINITAPHSTVYKFGEKKVYSAQSTSGVSFDSVYYSRKGNELTELSDAPVNVGEYRVKFVYTSSDGYENYKAPENVANDFRITPQSLFVKVDDVNIQYGTAVANDKTALNPSANNRFPGYTVSFIIGNQQNGVIITESDLIAQEGDKIRGLDSYKFVTEYKSNSPAFVNNRTNTFDVSVSGISADNYAIEFVTGTISVIPRNITVRVKGAEQNVDIAKRVYSGSEQRTDLEKLFMNGQNYIATAQTLNAFFAITDTDWAGSSGNGIADLKFFLTIDGGSKDVGTYKLLPSYNNSNYAVTFDGKDQSGYVSAVFEITPATLTVSVWGISSTDVTKKPVKDFEITYGEVPEFAPNYAGFKGGDSIENLRGTSYMSGELDNDNSSICSTYTAWSSSVGNYTTRYSGTLQFKNYTVEYAECDFKVVARHVTADIADKNVFQKYAYNEGHAVIPVITFADGFSSEDAKVIELLLSPDKFTLSYTASGTGGLTADVKPKFAGDYNVTVTLTNNNFTLGNDTELSFTVEKKIIEIAWDNTNMSWDTEKGSTRVIEAFRSDIMKIAEFIHQVSDNTVGKEVSESLYTIGENNRVFTFKPNSTGRYTIRISLTDTANYKLSNQYSILLGGNDNNVILTLMVTGTKVDLSVSIEGWTFGSYNEEVNSPKPNTENQGSAGTISFYYAKTTLSSLDGLSDELKASFNDIDNLFEFGINGLAAFGAGVPTDAGVYLVRAYASGSGTNAFKAFVILPKEIDAPVFAPSGYEYNGNRQEYEIALSDSAAINVLSVGCGVRRDNGKVYVYATDANESGYEITFRLSSGNYVWKGKTGDDSTADITGNKWIIRKAADEITFAADTAALANGVVYGVDYTPDAEAKFRGQVYYFYFKGDGKPAAGNAGWSNVKPVNAGNYWIKANTANTANYNGGTAIVKLVITPAVLVATPFGTMTYGDDFLSATQTSAFGYTLRGFVRGDNSSNTQPMQNNATYSCSETLTAGEHALTIGVNGIKFANYVVTAESGTLTVAKKTVRVTVNSRSSQYGLDLLLSTDGIVIDDSSVTVGELGITLGLAGVSAGAIPSVGSYTITAACSSPNHTVSVSSGTYTVLARKLRIDLKSGAKLGGNVGDVIAASKEHFDLFYDNDGNAGDRVTSAEIYNALNFVYSTQNGAVPSAMGNYFVTASVVLMPQNYEITGQNTFAFIVERGVIDGSKITVSIAKYTGGKIVPVIDFGDYESIKDYFEVITDNSYDYENVGTHIFHIRIKDSQFANVKWQSYEDADRPYALIIERSENSVVKLEIENWTYGESSSVPVAGATFGEESEFVYTYYRKEGASYVNLGGVPTEAGTYYVRVSVPQSANWLACVSDYIEFTVARASKAVPSLQINPGVNDTYTGDFLWAQVSGFAFEDMSIIYGGVSNISGNSLMVQALGAGTYSIKFVLKNQNYAWADNGNVQFDSEGNPVLNWTVARKKIAKPTHNTNSFIVSGKILEYFPFGFDSSIMSITGNESGYGGTFTATVKLLDTDNYEWEDGTAGELTFEWKIVGVHTVFAAIMGTLGGAAGVAAAVAAVQFVLYRKKKRAERRELARLNGEEEAA